MWRPSDWERKISFAPANATSCSKYDHSDMHPTRPQEGQKIGSSEGLHSPWLPRVKKEEK